MIPVPNTITQEDTLPSHEEIEFTIGDPRWVMRTQAELYSDPTTAVIREYSTNAFDAHVMAGHTDPIEVTLPSQFNDQIFTVRDHGVGMSLDDFRQIYTRFGTSNKRDSNTTNGQLGYGSKSGVAYGTSFTVTSVKDGIKNVGIVQRKPDWTIVLKVVSTVKTDEPNGTVIQIPVSNVEEFTHKANEFYKFWLPGRVLVNGKAPNHAVGKQIIENLYYSEQWNTSYVVMGNVAYRIANPDALFRSTKMNRINFVAYVDEFKTEDGSAPVEFTPSREDLKYTDRTKGTLQKIVDDFESNIIRVAQDEINAATSHFDAYVKWTNWSSMLGKGLFADLEFNGDKFESQFAITGKEWTTGGYRNSVYSIRQFDVDKMDRTMVVTEFPVEVSSNVKAKAKEFARMKGWPYTYILFTADRKKDIKSKWISKKHFVTWEELKAALPKKVRQPGTYATGGGRIKGSYDLFTRNGRKDEQQVKDTKGQLYYISIQDEKNVDVPSVLRLLDMDNTVILLGANRINKFKRDYPKVQDFYTWARSQVVVKAETLLSQDAKDGLSVSNDLGAWLDKLPLDQVKDPAFAKAQAKRKAAKSLTKKYDDNITLANKVGMMYNVVKYTPTYTDFGLLRQYPLMKEFSHWRVEASVAREIVYYINAKHAASKS
jgi:hypothetical protein